MTFQFTHKNYTTSPKSFQAWEHALLPVSESEGKTLFLHRFITAAAESSDLLGILPFLQKGPEPPADTGTGMPCPLGGEELAWLDGSKRRLCVSSVPRPAHTTIHTKLCKPERTTVNSPKAHSWRAGRSSFFFFFLKEWEELPLSATVTWVSEDITAATIRKWLSCPDGTMECSRGAAKTLQTGNRSLDFLEVFSSVTKHCAVSTFKFQDTPGIEVAPV